VALYLGDLAVLGTSFGGTVEPVVETMRIRIIAKYPCKRAKPTPGLEPGTPSLRVNSGALAGSEVEWLEVALSRENFPPAGNFVASLHEPVFGRLGTDWARLAYHLTQPDVR
jgi:hypothetical protein